MDKDNQRDLYLKLRYFPKVELYCGVADIFLFLFAIRFLNKNITFLLIYVSLCVLLCILRKTFRASLEGVVLLIFGLFYYFTSLHWGARNNVTELMMYALGAPLMYFAGQNYMIFAENKELHYRRVVWISAIGMFLFAILSYLKYGVVYNYADGADIRAIPDFWIGYRSIWQATNINGYCVLSIILSIVCLIQKGKKIRKAICIILLAGSLYLSLVTAGRTNLLLIVLVLISYLILILLSKNYSWDIYKGNGLKFVIVIVCVVLILPIIVINMETILLKLPLEAFVDRVSNHHLSVAEDGRWEMWAKVIMDIPDHFWGNITSVELAHNLYLDVARVSGVIPMALLIVYTVLVVMKTISLFRDERYTIQFRILNSVLILSMLATFMIEPVMTAKTFIFITFCMLCGMQKQMLEADEEYYGEN